MYLCPPEINFSKLRYCSQNALKHELFRIYQEYISVSFQEVVEERSLSTFTQFSVKLTVINTKHIHVRHTFYTQYF